MAANKFWTASAAACVAITLAGCNQSPAPTAPADPIVKTAHSHDAWWCDEHGVPEEVCALCSAKVAAECQAKGDWCKEHDRPESQCFVCHPDKAADFAALYEAKYGKQPPQPTKSGAAAGDAKHDHDHDHDHDEDRDSGPAAKS